MHGMMSFSCKQKRRMLMDLAVLNVDGIPAQLPCNGENDEAFMYQ